MFYGQHQEDAYINTFFNSSYKGVCVEVGAYDGINMSNTYYFEKNGWNVLCIEPCSIAFDKCNANRKLSKKCCISDSDKEDMDFTVFSLGNNLSAISSLIPDERLITSHNHLITNTYKEKVKVRSLTSVMNEINFPKKIDFISIDTENTELDVLKGIDFNLYDIKMFIIENNYNEPFCEEYLKPLGYKKINRIEVNDFFIKE